MTREVYSDIFEHLSSNDQLVLYDNAKGARILY